MSEQQALVERLFDELINQGMFQFLSQIGALEQQATAGGA